MGALGLPFFIDSLKRTRPKFSLTLGGSVDSMAWTIIAGTFAVVTLILVLVYVSTTYIGLGKIYNFAPDNGSILMDTRTMDGAYIVPMAQRPYFAERCSKKVRDQIYNGYCW